MILLRPDAGREAINLAGQEGTRRDGRKDAVHGMRSLTHLPPLFTRRPEDVLDDPVHADHPEDDDEGGEDLASGERKCKDTAPPGESSARGSHVFDATPARRVDNDHGSVARRRAVT